MKVYIKDMEMPRGCASCKISRRNGKKMICPFIWKCEWDIHDPMSADHRLDGCPLVPVPEHGRLIDANALTYVMGMDERFSVLEAMYLMGVIAAAPTIIPAEEGE